MKTILKQIVFATLWAFLSIRSISVHAQSEEQKLIEAISKDPENSKLYEDLALVYYKANNWNASIENLNKAIQKNPKDTVFYYDLATVYDTQKNDAGKLEAYKLFAKNLPCADAYNNIAFIYFAQKDYPNAISNFKQAFKYDPTDYKCVNNIGICYEQGGKLDSAGPYFEKSVSINPKYGKPYIGIARYYDKKGDLKKYVENYEKAIAFDETGALKYSQQNEDEYADFMKKKEIVKNPTADAYCGLADSYFNRKDYQAALRTYQTALTKDPNHGQAQFQIGLIYLQMLEKPDYDKAISYLSKSVLHLKSDMDRMAGYENLGYAYELKKDYNTALVNYQKGVEIDPNFAKTIYFKMSRVYDKIGDPKKADLYKRKSY